MAWKNILGAVALSIALQPLALPAAHADDVTIRFVPETVVSDPIIVREVETVTPKVIETPIVIPHRTVTESTTTILEPAREVHLAPVVESPVVESRVLQQSTVIEKAPAPATVTTHISATARKPLFHERLSNIKKQVNTGLANGWLSSAQAAEFSSRADSIMSNADAHLLSDADEAMGDSIERQVNQLNIDVTDSMQY